MTNIILESQNLTRYYCSTLALDNMTVKIPRGCICGFIGRNGSGKTTAIKLLLGFLKPTAGCSKLLGHDSQELTPQIRQRIGYVSGLLSDILILRFRQPLNKSATSRAYRLDIVRRFCSHLLQNRL